MTGSSICRFWSSLFLWWFFLMWRQWPLCLFLLHFLKWTISYWQCSNFLRNKLWWYWLNTLRELLEWNFRITIKIKPSEYSSYLFFDYLVAHLPQEYFEVCFINKVVSQFIHGFKSSSCTIVTAIFQVFLLLF
jgi:hypothetical protein